MFRTSILDLASVSVFDPDYIVQFRGTCFQDDSVNEGRHAMAGTWRQMNRFARQQLE
jgi:hypothetical protein